MTGGNERTHTGVQSGPLAQPSGPHPFGLQLPRTRPYPSSCRL